MSEPPATRVVTIKIRPAMTSPQQTSTTTATLATVADTDLDTATLLTSIKAPLGLQAPRLA